MRTFSKLIILSFTLSLLPLQSLAQLSYDSGESPALKKFLSLKSDLENKGKTLSKTEKDKIQRQINVMRGKLSSNDLRKLKLYNDPELQNLSEEEKKAWFAEKDNEQKLLKEERKQEALNDKKGLGLKDEPGE